MKRFTAIAALFAGLLLSACDKPASTAGNSTPEPKRRAPEPTPAPAPAPEASNTAPAPTTPVAAEMTPVQAESTPPAAAPPAPPPKVLAPPGTLFAIERISVTTDDGVFTVAAGARLKIIRKQGDGYLVSDTKHEFPVEAHQVTNELDAATTAAQFTHAERTAESEASRAITAAQTQINRLQQTQDAAAAKAAARERRRQDLLARRLTLVSEIAKLNARIEQSEYYPYRPSVDPNVRVAWKQRLAVASEERRTVDAELSRLGYPQD
jgi:hypothetical protein